ncbi:Serine/threonine-protein kinase 25 [Operophtera brumata]|uniref:Serine/threonine-protein kinase 25 n=1 Tax=Operophtera brumata TaxID=104452 RepID=A0A0L7LNN4_OPEBR|nr:Serine/threonine-protein kinase 25 [Operophtera brumata]
MTRDGAKPLRAGITTSRQSPIVPAPVEQRSSKERERDRSDREDRKERQDHQPSNRDSVVYNKAASPLDHRGPAGEEKVRKHPYLQQLIYPLLNEVSTSPLDHRGPAGEEKVRKHPYLQQLIYPLLNELSRKHGSGSVAAIEELRRAFEHAERSAPHLTRAFVQQVVQRVATQSHQPATPSHNSSSPWMR